MEPYLVPDEFIRTPPRGHLEQALYVKHIDIRGKLVQPPMRYDKVDGGNLILEYLMSAHGPQVVDRLMTVTFKQRRGVVSDDASQEILKRGIVFSGEMYRFLGHSNSQLKEKTCFLMNASDEDIYELLALFGKFSKIKTAAKRAKRVGLLFSTFERSISLEEHEYDVIDDVERGKYIFTDGCGLMSDAFAQQIQDVRGLNAKPSVVQVRYQGFKGVLLLSRQLGDRDQVKVHFRKSMKKFAIPDERMRQTCNTFGVVKCSRPYAVGYLNKQITMLLADSGVNHGYLTGLQNDFHAMLRELCGTAQSTEYYLRIKGEQKLLEWLHNYGLESHRLKKELKALRAKEVKKMQKDHMADEGGVIGDDDDDSASPTQTSKCKLRVLVPKSRVVFGVCDPLDELHYGECVFQPTLFDEVQLAEFQAASEVMVVRNPCYFVGDIRVLKLVKDRPQYAHLSDCIVFPTRGARPHADESSGGDLDGDEFFVSWDEELIPRWRSLPFDYSYTSPLMVVPKAIKKYFEQVASSVRHHVTAWGHRSLSSLFGTPQQAEKARKEKERRHMLEYFTSFNNDLVGRVDAIFMKYAALYGPSCEECVYLNRFFSDAVDMVAEKEEVVAKLRELEREYKRIEQNPPNRHSLDVFGRLLGWIAGQRPQFHPGNDVWTRMEEKTRLFVEEMSGRN